MRLLHSAAATFTRLPYALPDASDRFSCGFTPPWHPVSAHVDVKTGCTSPDNVADGLTHVPPQSAWGAVQFATHAPAEHATGQVVPHAPQFSASFCRSTHAPLHAVRPGSHVVPGVPPSPPEGACAEHATIRAA